MDATKVCFKCERELPLAEFYDHPAMGDGKLGKCKECTRRDVRENYAKNREHYSEYDRQRFQTPERKRQAAERQKRRREADPFKDKARNAVSNAVRDGRLTKQPCEVCGKEQVEAHHEDYSKPLDVRWLCFQHHREAHGQVVTCKDFAHG